jgi:hypothetical protein
MRPTASTSGVDTSAMAVAATRIIAQANIVPALLRVAGIRRFVILTGISSMRLAVRWRQRCNCHHKR